MRRIVLALLLLSAAGPAFAGCNPPPGLPIQQFYAMCGGDLQQAYASGMGQGAPFEAFVNWVYSNYRAGPQMPAQYPQQNAGQMTGVQQCQLGESMCFSGWFRSCQRVGNGTMWITGAQRC